MGRFTWYRFGHSIWIRERKCSIWTKNKTSNGLKAGIIVALQPLLYTLYNLLHSLFVSYKISQQLGIKTLLFAIFMLISYLIVISFLNFNKKKVKDRLGQKRSVQTFVFKPTKRIYDGYFIFIISLVCYIVYLSINNGSEGAVLIVNTVLSMLCFAYTNSAIPITKQKYICLKILNQIRRLNNKWMKYYQLDLLYI